MSEKTVSVRDWFILILLALIWGVSFLFIKKAVAIYTPIQTAFWRVSLSCIFNLPILYVYRSQINWAKWKPMAVIALAGSAVPSVLFAFAQQKVESSTAGILNALTPLFTVLLALVVYRTKVSRNKIIGVLLGLLGAAVLILLDPDKPSSGQSHLWAAGFCILATVCYAFSANTITHHLQTMHPAAIGAGAFTLLSPFFFTGLIWSGGIAQLQSHPDGLKGLLYIIFLSGVGTVLASFLYFGLIQRTGAVFGTSVTYLLPVVSIFFGLLDGEAIHFTDLIGSGIILMALYLAKRG
jgi:drug/metabolite transporter (DMT)-like permease